MSKPLLRFDFLVPYGEAEELAEPIKSMVRQADSLRERVELLALMLNDCKGLNTDTIFRLFYSMAKNEMSFEVENENNK